MKIMQQLSSKTTSSIGKNYSIHHQFYQAMYQFIHRNYHQAYTIYQQIW